MTNQERLDFVELRKEMREGFMDLARKVEAVDHRVQSLEQTRIEAKVVAQERERMKKELATQNAAARWKIDRIITYVLAAVGATFTLITIIQKAVAS